MSVATVTAPGVRPRDNGGLPLKMSRTQYGVRNLPFAQSARQVPDLATLAVPINTGWA